MLATQPSHLYRLGVWWAATFSRPYLLRLLFDVLPLRFPAQFFRLLCDCLRVECLRTPFRARDHRSLAKLPSAMLAQPSMAETMIVLDDGTPSAALEPASSHTTHALPLREREAGALRVGTGGDVCHSIGAVRNHLRLAGMVPVVWLKCPHHIRHHTTLATACSVSRPE